jgi:hypothetical protein
MTFFFCVLVSAWSACFVIKEKMVNGYEVYNGILMSVFGIICPILQEMNYLESNIFTISFHLQFNLLSKEDVSVHLI